MASRESKLEVDVGCARVGRCCGVVLVLQLAVRGTWAGSRAWTFCGTLSETLIWQRRLLDAVRFLCRLSN